MNSKGGRPRQWYRALYTVFRWGQGTRLAEITRELFGPMPRVDREAKGKIQRYIRDFPRWKARPPTLTEVADAFAWAEGLLGEVPAHDRGRPELRVVLRRQEDGSLPCERIALTGFTSWEELKVRIISKTLP